MRLMAVAAALALPLSGCASAPTGEALRDGAPALPPQGWLGFCARNADDPSCKAVLLDGTRQHDLALAATVARAIPRRNDQARFGQSEFWQVADASGGDCEDIALAARARLLAAGWPVSALRLATTLTERGERHVVLTIDVVTARGPSTLVVDSRFAHVESWQALRDIGYRFAARQAPHGPGWVTIAGNTAPVGLAGAETAQLAIRSLSTDLVPDHVISR